MCKKILFVCFLSLGLSSQAAVTPIATLRMMQDANWLPTDTTTIFEAEGVVITHTNVTGSGDSAPNSQFYMQDATAGIAVFYNTNTARPKAGDKVNVKGPLGHFNGLFELNLNRTNLGHVVTPLNTGNPLPAPYYLSDFTVTNDTALMETSLEGRYTVVSNVFIQGTGNFPSGTTLLITNGMGQTFVMFISAATDIKNTPKPTGPVDIFGVMGQFDGADPRSEGYQFIPTRLADFHPKAPVTLFTNNLSNLVRPGDAITSTTYKDYALRPSETITIQTRSFDQLGASVTISPVSNNLPANAQWTYGATSGLSVPATFTFTPNSTNAGSNFVVTLNVSNNQAMATTRWNIYVPKPDEQQIIISEFLANSTGDTNSPFFNPLRRPSPGSTNAFADDEFVEVVNLGAVGVELVGWTLSDDVQARHTFFEFHTLSSSNAVILYGGPLNNDPVPPAGLPVASFPLNPGSANSIFNNGGDSISLRNENGYMVARVVYSAITSPNGIAQTRYSALQNGFLRHDAANCTNASPGAQYDGLPYSMPPAPVTNPSAPILSAIADQVTLLDTATGPISFTVSDVETAAGSLMVTAHSSNPTLVPNSSVNLALGGSGNNRDLTITPAAGQTGVATILVTVKDGGNRCLSESFLLSVTPDIGIVLCDSFDYANGSLITNSMFLWSTHSGSTGQVQVAGGQLKVLESQSEDVHADLTNAPYATSGGAVLYAGFTVNFQSLPSIAGEYFAHFMRNSLTFRGRIFASTTNAAPGTYRLGIANNAGAMPLDSQVATDLSLNTTHRVVVRYGVSSGLTTLWVNPASESSPSVSATDDPSLSEINAFAFRQTGGIGSNCADNVKVAGKFFLVTSPTLTIVREGAGVKLSWPRAARDVGYVLQRTMALPGGWADFNPPVVNEGDQSVVIIENPTDNAFFQLRK